MAQLLVVRWLAIMKTLTMIVVAAIFGAGLFVGGWWFGSRQKTQIEDYATPILDTRLADALSKASVLHLMDAGHYSDARAMLQGQLNLSVVSAIGLEAGLDDRRLEEARRVCAKMVAYRDEYPSNYVSDPALGQTWTDQQVDSYLRKVGEIKP